MRATCEGSSSLLQRLSFTCLVQPLNLLIFFFNDTAPTEIYTLSLHDALPISSRFRSFSGTRLLALALPSKSAWSDLRSESTRLNSSHSQISYAVFCLKKKTQLERWWLIRSSKSRISIRISFRLRRTVVPCQIL